MERFVINLATGLQAEGISSELIIAFPHGHFRDAVPEVLPLSVLGSEHMLASLPRLALYLKRTKPAILLSALDHANVIALWARAVSKASCRVICTVHKPLSQAVQDSPLLRERLFLIPAVRASYSRADAIVAVSAGVADDLVRTAKVPHDHITIIHNPVVTDDLIARSMEPLNHPWFGDGEPPVVLAVGRLSKEKDYPTMLRAFRRVRAQRSAHLVILGEGEDRDALEQLATDLGVADDVDLLGFKKNPYPYMRHASVFAMSSTYEGLPTVMIEAMACGTPVVSTDCPNGPREILQGGRYGKLVPIRDDEALATAVLTSLSQPVPAGLTQRASDFALDTAIAAYRHLLRV